jgi:hypothetical protein
MDLDTIVAPHEPRDQAKLAALVVAYTDNADVPPVVVVRVGDRRAALSGSHRLAAMRAAYPRGTELDWEVIEVDGDAIYDGSSSDEARLAIEQLAGAGPDDFGAAIDALLPYLPADAVAALEGQ